MSPEPSLKHHLIEVVGLANREGRDFLVIGGLCVTLYGIERLTRDIDLLIPERDSLAWRLMLERLGYRFLHGTHAFQQFDGVAMGRPPLDLMLVDDATWGKLDALARTVPLDASTSARLPEPLHCVAMKLKAVTSTQRRADNQDWGDILNLFRLFRIDPADGRTRELVLRYGDAALLDRLRADLERLP